LFFNILIYSFYDYEGVYYRGMENGFKEYCKQNNLNIRINLKVLTPENSTSEFANYGEMIDTLISNKSDKYDIYFYYSDYSKKYGNHFLNLKNYMSEKYFEGYDERLLKETCSSVDGELIALPIYMDVSTLFSNFALLSKYNKSIPKTWDELMSTSKYIYDEEKKFNNNIIRYFGFFNDHSGSVSLYEYINSYRESNNSPHPKITSKTTKEALQDLKAMKDELGEEMFNTPEEKAIGTLLQGMNNNTLFLRYLYMMHDPGYNVTALPGQHDGVSGSVVIPNNFAVNKHIDDERKKAAIEFMKFVSSKESHKKYIISTYLYSPIIDLYYDEEVCKIIECNVIKDAYPFSFMNNDVNVFGDDEYHVKYRENMFDYLYHDKPLPDVLKKIQDITKIYTFSLKTDDTKAGLIIFIVFQIFLIFMILSLTYVFIRDYENRFRFLSKKLWVITTLGSLILLCSILTLYDNLTNTSCHLKITLINVGFVLSICPSLNTLITNFPEDNKMSFWFKKNKHISILLIIIFTASLNGILAMSSYNLQTETMSDGRNYKKCVMNSMFGKVIYYLIQLYDFLIILATLILIFIEWNIKETSLDVKYLATALFMDSLSLIFLIIVENIKFKDYVMYNILLSINIMIFSVFNHLFVYFIRVLPIFGNNSKFEDSRRILGKISSSRTSNDTITFSTSSTYDSQLNKITKKLMSYHTQTNSYTTLN